MIARSFGEAARFLDRAQQAKPEQRHHDADQLFRAGEDRRRRQSGGQREPAEEIVADEMPGECHAADPADEGSPAGDEDRGMSRLDLVELDLGQMRRLRQARQRLFAAQALVVAGEQAIEHAADRLDRPADGRAENSL